MKGNGCVNDSVLAYRKKNGEKEPVDKKLGSCINSLSSIISVDHSICWNTREELNRVRIILQEISNGEIGTV